MGFKSILSYAQQLIKETIRPKDIVVDATVGNGNDTLFLAKLVGPHGYVYGFDIQRIALENAHNRCDQELIECTEQITWIHQDHADLLTCIPKHHQGQISGIMFNLGYLPGSDHTVTTQVASTLTALESSIKLIKPNGLITVVLYSGHPGGKEEVEAIISWVKELPQERYQVLQYQFLNQINDPPILIAIRKK